MVSAHELAQLVEEQLELSRKQRARIRELEARSAGSSHGPIAVVGMGMRLPGGVTSPEDFWQMLMSDSDVVSPIPDDRPGLRRHLVPGPATPGRSYVDRAAFLTDVALFDPEHFAISQREAEALDPQQRLLLEVVWESAERAGVALDRAAGLDAGVFVAMMSSEYGDRIAAGPPADIDPYFGTGRGLCFASGRISHAFGLTGPSLTLDTACSSSLVALHQAVRSLRDDECRYAFAAAANLLFSGELMVSLCQSGALSPSGRSRAFMADADGYGRGEGVLALTLMRLADAQAERRPVLAVIRGSATNHDGLSSGLTVPNGQQQVDVIRAAHADAGIEPHAVSYVETHGTGTRLGDPIEARALSTALDAETRRRPVALGTLKSRIGHLEAAAGLASVAKVVLSLEHGAIPAATPAGEPNPLIPWGTCGLDLPRETASWDDEQRLAGVSAFGLSGTNAHVVLGPAESSPPPTTSGKPLPLVVTARSEQQLDQLRHELADRLQASADDDNLVDVARTLWAGRSRFEHRLAVTASTLPEAARALREAPVYRTRRPDGPATLCADAPTAAAVLETLLGLDPRLQRPESAGPQALADVLSQLGVPTSIDSAPSAGTATVTLGADTVGLAGPSLSDTGDRVIVSALVRLFALGFPVDLGTLVPDHGRIRPDLPTYPFERRRCWIVESVPASEVPVVASIHTGPDPLPGPEPEPDRDATWEWLAGELRSVLRAHADAPLDASFLDLGGDSFTAMLFLRSVEERFAVADPGMAFDAEVPLSSLLDQLCHRIHSADVTVPAAARP